MSWALIVDIEQGTEALIFRDQREADAWEEAHPEVTDYVISSMPVITRLAALREIKKFERKANR